MTVPMDCTISYTAGTLFAVASRSAIEQSSELESESLARGRLFTALVTIPIGIYFLSRWPDWSWMYTAGNRGRSPLLGAAGMAGYFASHEAGFRLGARLVRSGKTRWAAANAVLSFIGFIAIVVFGWNRFRWQGTFEEYREGTAVDCLVYPGFIIPLGASMITFFLAAVLVSFLNYLAGKKATGGQ